MNPTSNDLKTCSSSGEHLYDYKLVLLSEKLLSTNVLSTALADVVFVDKIRSEMYQAEGRFPSSPSFPDLSVDNPTTDTSMLKASDDLETGSENGTTPTLGDFENVSPRERAQTLVGKVASVFTSSFMVDVAAKEIEMTATMRSTLHRRLFICENRNIEFEAQKEKYEIKSVERNIKDVGTISDISGLNGHIVLVGVQDELPMILRELRQAAFMNKHHLRPILIFGDVHPSVFCPKLVSNRLLEQVYYMKGTADLKTFLKNADFLGLKDCYSLNIFPTAYMAQNAGKKNVDKKIDVADRKRDDLEADIELLFHYFSLQKKLLKIDKIRSTDYSCHLNLRLYRASNLPVLNAKAVRQVEKFNKRKLKHIFPKMNNKATSFPDDSFFHTSCEKKAEGIDINESTSMLHLDKNIASESFWNFSLSPFSLPMSASGKAFVAGAFDAFSVQLFLNTLVGPVSKALVKGQTRRTPDGTVTSEQT